MTDTLAVESFIDFCDDMTIKPAQEGMFQTIKNKIVDIFLKLVKAIESFVKKRKDSKFKDILMGLLKRARTGLEKAKGIKEGDTTEALEEEAKTIKSQFDQVQDAADEVNKYDNKPKGSFHVGKKDAKEKYYKEAYSLIQKIYASHPDIFEYNVDIEDKKLIGMDKPMKMIYERFLIRDDDECRRIGAQLGLHTSDFIFVWNGDKTHLINGPSRL